jgi:hypothetical protein
MSIRRISTENVNNLTEDELNLISYVIKEHMGLDPLFICSIKKKKIFDKMQEVQNLLNENGKQVSDSIFKKIFIEYKKS